MAYLCSLNLRPIRGDMNCKLVACLQNQQKHLTPDQSQSQGRVYGLLLRAFLRGKGQAQPPIRYEESHPETPRPATKLCPGRPVILQPQWIRRN
jgi:hypothetical protein